MSLKVRKLTEEPGIDEVEEGFSGVNTVWVVLKRDDLAGFSSRIFRIEPGGHTSMHAHDREHVAVVVRGTIRVESNSDVWDVKEGSIITVPMNKPHRFINPGHDRVVLLIMNFFTPKTTTGADAPTGGEP